MIPLWRPSHDLQERVTVVEGNAGPRSRAWHGDQSYATARLHVAAAPERCSQGVLNELAQGHPQRGRLGLRLHEKLIVDVNGRAHRLCPS
jgi:hypothetical protein